VKIRASRARQRSRARPPEGLLQPRLSVGELRGKQAVIDYFATAATILEFRPFETPLGYFGDGDRVVIVGDETFRVKETGVTHKADWAWVYDVHDGLITRILAIEDLSGIEDVFRHVVATAQSGGASAA
jgi:ketosteroid isomerase-like protein